MRGVSDDERVMELKRLQMERGGCIHQNVDDKLNIVHGKADLATRRTQPNVTINCAQAFKSKCMHVERKQPPNTIELRHACFRQDASAENIECTVKCWSTLCLMNSLSPGWYLQRAVTKIYRGYQESCRVKM